MRNIPEAAVNVLVFEWLNGGGLWIDGGDPDSNLTCQLQGRAMLECVSADLIGAGFKVYTLRDSRLRSEDEIGTELRVHQRDDVIPSLSAIADAVDLIILIAPESNWRLLECCQAVQSWSDKLVSPDKRFVRLTSNKNATASWLGDRGVRVANGSKLSNCHGGWRFPDDCSSVVIKPALGAGSDQVSLVEDGTFMGSLDDSIEWRVEEFVAGRPASVTVLCGLENEIYLTPTWQILNGEFGAYLSAEPIENTLTAARLTELARETIRALPRTRGYIGIDMVVGTRACVVDVNPRITTSYCHLRELEDFNIADVMIEIATRDGCDGET